MSRGSRRRRTNTDDDTADNGFAQWGGYMAAKQAKLLDQYASTCAQQTNQLSTLFGDVAIFVNGLTNPNADQLKQLMAEHGGIYHVYQCTRTTHIIASNLPNVKIKRLGTVPIVKPAWIVDSIAANRLLDYRRYLLYTNQSSAQPQLDFSVPASDAGTSATKTASDPKFIAEFYSNSRLHLIATLGAEFKQLIGEWRDTSDGQFPKRQQLITDCKKSQLTISSPIIDVQPQVIMHIDMDCFFVSVGRRNRPDLQGKPVAVTHASRASGNAAANRGADRDAEFALYLKRLPEGVVAPRIQLLDGHASMSEIASCSYEARECGVRNGMFLGTASKLCPELVPIPYDFQDYKNVSKLLYEIIAQYTLDIEAVSCDEMYVDVTQLLRETGKSVDEWATYIRTEITTATGCPCSAGFGANRLLARMATKRAKPAGQYYLNGTDEDIATNLAHVKLSDLPGVGQATLAKLTKCGLVTCGDIQSVAILPMLRRELGAKLGETLYDQAHGIDRKPLTFQHERKSISAEINYGIRFQSLEECHEFLERLALELYGRMGEVKVRAAKCLTLKLLVRAAEAPMETAKFLGHGICDSFSKSVNNVHIADAKTIYNETKLLYGKFKVDYKELRGIGIQLSKLEKVQSSTGGANTAKMTGLTKFLTTYNNKDNPTAKKTGIPTEVVDKSSKSNDREKKVDNSRKQDTTSRHNTQLVAQSEPIDWAVLNELPLELRNEIIREYQLQDVVNAPAPYPADAVTASTDVGNADNQKNGGATTGNNLFAGLNSDDLKMALQQWMQSVTEPADVDVDMLSEHFKEMAINRQIELLRVLFNFLFRNLNQRSKGCKWHKAYIRLVNTTQEGMIARYGGTLFVPRRFGCCD